VVAGKLRLAAHSIRRASENIPRTTTGSVNPLDAARRFSYLRQRNETKRRARRGSKSGGSAGNTKRARAKRSERERSEASARVSQEAARAKRSEGV
jgi:hypothetical protein